MFRLTTGAGVLAGAALLLAGMAASPAGAGVEWSDPQEVSSRYGWQVSLSDDGQMAAWIRVGNRPGPGPVHTAKYLSARKGWSKSKQVPGSAEATEVALAGDGNTLLVKVPTGYGVSSRSGSSNGWSAVSPIADGGGLRYGSISGDGGTAVWVDPTCGGWPGPIVPGKVLSRERAADGTWGPQVTVGEFTCNDWGPDGSRLALSANGAAAAWVNNSRQLVAALRAADGSWAAPVLVQQYGSDGVVGNLQLSATGSRLVWQSGTTGVLTSIRSTSGWSDPTYVMQNDVESVAMSPNGRVVAYGQRNPDRLRVRRYASSKWISPTTLGPSRVPRIVVRDKAVAWVEDTSAGPGSKLWVSLLSKGKWGKAVKVAPKAQSPALSSNADTLAWAGTGAGKIFSVTR